MSHLIITIKQADLVLLFQAIALITKGLVCQDELSHTDKEVAYLPGSRLSPSSKCPARGPSPLPCQKKTGPDVGQIAGFFQSLSSQPQSIGKSIAFLLRAKVKTS